jgi:hypothetical protein
MLAAALVVRDERGERPARRRFRGVVAVPIGV